MTNASWQPLRSRDAFGRLYHDGRRLDSRLIRCMFFFTDDTPSTVRAAFAVPGKEFISVQRHRIKRLMRESLRKEIPALHRSLAETRQSVSLILMFKGTKEMPRPSLQSVQESVASICLALRGNV